MPRFETSALVSLGFPLMRYSCRTAVSASLQYLQGRDRGKAEWHALQIRGKTPGLSAPKPVSSATAFQHQCCLITTYDLCLFCTAGRPDQLSNAAPLSSRQQHTSGFESDSHAQHSPKPSPSLGQNPIGQNPTHPTSSGHAQTRDPACLFAELALLHSCSALVWPSLLACTFFQDIFGRVSA